MAYKRKTLKLPKKVAKAAKPKADKAGGVYVLTPAEESQYYGAGQIKFIEELAKRFGTYSKTPCITRVRTSKGQAVGDFPSSEKPDK